MQIVLVESQPDPASVGIAAALRRRPGWRSTASSYEGRPVWALAPKDGVRLVTIPALHIHAEGLDEALRSAGLAPDLIVFLSKHRSESGRPTLTAHAVGNYGDNALGGRAGLLTPTLGPYLSQALRALASIRASSGYAAEIAFETTHHGPALTTPCFFLELGSSEAQWAEEAGHRVVAEAVDWLLGPPPPAYPVVVGLGGGHYAPRFTEAVLTKQVHLAHIVPTHFAKSVKDVPTLAAEVVRASPGATGVYYQDGTLPREIRTRWLDAFQKAGLPAVESRAWPPLNNEGGFDASTNNALTRRPE